MAMAKKKTYYVKASELTIGLDEEDILYSLQLIEKTRRDREKEFNYIPYTRRWLDNRTGWLVQKYRVLSQNNLIGDSSVRRKYKETKKD